MTQTATLVIDSTKLTPEVLAELEAAIYGTDGQEPRLPLPDEIMAIVNQITLKETSGDPGTYTIYRKALIEDPTDVGTYFIIDTNSFYVDPADPGTYIIE